MANVNIGQLNKKIKILRKTEVTGEDFITEENLVEYKTCWANVRDYKRGEKEDLEKGDYAARATINAIIRYQACPDVRLSDFLEFKGIRYNIRYIDRGEYNKRFIEIQGIEADDNGYPGIVVNTDATTENNTDTGTETNTESGIETETNSEEVTGE